MREIADNWIRPVRIKVNASQIAVATARRSSVARPKRQAKNHIFRHHLLKADITLDASLVT
jgi:hypothetical protein